MTTHTLPSVAESGSFSRFLAEIWRFPILNVEEEYMLAQRWHQQGDVEAAHKLVTSHLRLVAKIALEYKGYGLPVADLVSEGTIGLMKAVRKFEPERGFRLSTYAMWWIRAAVTEFVLQSWSLVRTGTLAVQKKLFFSLRRIKNRLKIVDYGELTPEDAKRLSKEIDVSENDVIDMNRCLSGRDASLNAHLSEDGNTEFQDVLEDEKPSPETVVAERNERNHRRTLLATAMANLSERERHIFVERRLKDDPVTLDNLGSHYGISRERVRQLENRAFQKIQKAMISSDTAI